MTEATLSREDKRADGEYHDGFRLAATKSQYPEVPRIRAFFDPSKRTTKEATMEQNIKDTYNIPRDIVPNS